MEIDDIQKIIRNSGNTFHCKVIEFFQQNGWELIISPYYSDNVTNKPREIDLLAQKDHPAFNQFGQTIGMIKVSLHIECKYINSANVFWFHAKDKSKAEKCVISNTKAKKDNIYTQQYHYIADNDSVAKLFAEGNGSKSADNEVFYKALTQCLNASIYFRKKASLVEKKTTYRDISSLNYSVIICNNFDRLYRTEMNASDEYSKISENFFLEVNYGYQNQEGRTIDEYFLVDIVDYNKLDDFLLKIGNDAKLEAFFAS